MKRVMFIGRRGCGKTTLCQALRDEKISYRKTQAMEFMPDIIDTPGEYIESRWFYNALIVSSAESDIIALIHECTRDDTIFPPGLSALFLKPIIGIVTKSDMCMDERPLSHSKELLKAAGAGRIFIVSALSGDGIKELKEYLNE